MAADAKPFKALIDPDAPEFVPAGNIPERIRRYCRESGQRVPENEAETCKRCIDESLAFKYRMTLEEIKMCTGRGVSGDPYGGWRNTERTSLPDDGQCVSLSGDCRPGGGYRTGQRSLSCLRRRT